MGTYRNARVDEGLANELVNELQDIKGKLATIEEKVLIELDLADLAEEVRHSIRVLSDRSNLK